MIGNADAARRELVALGDALTHAERGMPRNTPVELMTWLLRVAALHPTAVADAMLLQVSDLVAGSVTGNAEKIAVIRMGWAAIVQAQYKRQGLVAVDGQGAIRARAA